MDSKTQDWLLEHHKEGYKVQSELLNRIRDRIAFLSGLILPLGGGIVYLYANYPYAWRQGREFLFLAPLTVSSGFLAAAAGLALYCLGRGFRYKGIPTPQQIQRYAEKLAGFAAAHPDQNVDVLDDLKAHLADSYCKGATHNFAVNMRRSNYILRATQLAIISFGLLLVSIPRFVYDKSRLQTAPTSVIISEPISIKK